jgi:hypothetical protein
MPSKHMVRMPVDLYPYQAEFVNEIVEDNKLKKIRFLRECINHVLNSSTDTKKVINNCKTTNYVRVKK